MTKQTNSVFLILVRNETVGKLDPAIIVAPNNLTAIRKLADGLLIDLQLDSDNLFEVFEFHNPGKCDFALPYLFYHANSDSMYHKVKFKVTVNKKGHIDIKI